MNLDKMDRLRNSYMACHLHEIPAEQVRNLELDCIVFQDDLYSPL